MQRSWSRPRSLRSAPAALFAAAVTVITLGVIPAQAAPGTPSVVPTTSTGSDQAAPKPEEAADRQASPASPACPTPAEGQTVGCLERTAPHGLPAPARPDGDVSAADIVPIPEWCIDHAYEGVFGIRTAACEITGLTYTTYRTVNGTTTVTGEALMNVINYTYSATDLPTWAHQIELSAYTGSWGDALNATLSATPVSSGDCVTDSYSFPAKPLAPVGSWIQGESYFNTTATAPGAIGNCTTTWNLLFTNAPYTPAGIGYDMSEIRCDNATAGNASVGCVVPWYASALIYSQSSYPDLASHVSRAQASGLPGATFEAPLTRTTNDTIINQNRAMACGDAPSITGKSCDEYPIARSYEGLTSGGTRRTFDDCSFDLPRATGPTGVSVCMITATENNAQGGLNTQFFRRERVLDGDPFRVLIGA